MAHGSVNEAGAQIGAEGREESAFKLRTVVKDHALRDGLVLPHGGDQRPDRVIQGWITQEVTIDIRPGIIIQQGELVRRPALVGKGDLFKEVAVPQGMRVMALVETPHSRSRTWKQRSKNSAFDALGS